MMTITQKYSFLIKNLCCLWTLLIVSCCNIGHNEGSNQSQNKFDGAFILPSGKEMKVRLALSAQDQIKGVSGLRPQDFADDELLWFFYLTDDYRSFWMPDTYFDLDIIFIDEKLKIIRVMKSVPFHPGNKEPPRIEKTPIVFCRHVLEIKSSSSLATEFKEGVLLQWKGEKSLQQIEQDIRQH